MKNKYKSLIGNSILFGLGSLGSKFITFFMLPLYTYTLTKSEYGTVDLIQTTVNLLLPVITLSIFESVLRFALDKSENPKEILTSATFITVISSFIILFVGFLLQIFHVQYSLYLVLLLISQSIQSLFSQYLKAINKIKTFAFNGIFLTLISASLNVLFLLVFRLGMDGYFISLITSTIISDIYLVIRHKSYRDISRKFLNFDLLKRMLRYSTPLIPNSIALWANNAINRYFVLFFIGASANGLFAIANKIPTLLSVVNTIFFQSWQLSAIKEYDSEESGKFYSDTFNMYARLLFLGLSGILLILRPLMAVLVSDTFESSWRYVPFLLMTVLYSSFSSFTGQYYIAAKHTTEVFTTTIVGAVINVILNFILIPTMGLTGASLSSAFSFLVIWLIRFYSTQKFVKTEIDLTNQILNHIIIGLQITSLLLIDGWMGIMLSLFFFLTSVIINRRILLSMLSLVKFKR